MTELRGWSRERKAVRVHFSAPAAKGLVTLPEHVENTVWDVLRAFHIV